MPRWATDGPVRVAFFEFRWVEFHFIVRKERGSGANVLLDAVGRRSAAHVAFEVSDITAATANVADAELSFRGKPLGAGLGAYRRAFVAPEGHVGIPFEFVEPVRPTAGYLPSVPRVIVLGMRSPRAYSLTLSPSSQ